MSRYDIAIIGMGCVFPKANSIDQYWKNIESGDSYFSPMPKRLWHMEQYLSQDKTDPEKSYTMAGSFVEDFEFPFLEYKLPPAAMRGVDPTQLMTIDATKQALDDAGIPMRADILSEGITVVGASGVDAFAHSAAFLKRHRFIKRIRPHLEKHGVKGVTIDKIADEMTEELDNRGHIWAPSMAAVGAIPSSVSNRVAQVFGIRGFNMTLDAACASSFVAVDVACQALMSGDAKIAITGGADLGTNPPIYVGFSRVDGLSKKGEANSFDHTADGLVIGEGVGMVVLKRLEDALEDGDNIRGVIRGIGASSDGAGQAIYNPSMEGRAEALRWALECSETKHSEVQYLEAHATSTIVGDANEYDAISLVYGQERENSDPLYLGSVKAQIGHLKAAAGVAGLIKTVLAMENEKIPHLPRFTKLTPRATLPSDSLVIPTEIKQWRTGEDGKRVGAVTTSGFGGVNYHLILEQGNEYQRPAERPKLSREVAIVGVSLRVAGADTPEKFWQNITQGRDVFSKVNPEDFGWEDCFETGPENEIINTHVVSTLEPFDMNLLRHKIFPTAVSQISPTQLLGLEMADRLLEGGGFTLQEPKRVGVSVGSMHDDYFPTIFPPMLTDEHIDAFMCCPTVKELDPHMVDEACAQAKAQIRTEFPPVTEHTLPGWMTNVTAGRMANKLNLHGPNFTVDSACSSGVASLLPAIYQLMYGNVDMMITGGLNRQFSDTFTSGVCALGAVAKEVARPFDAEGQGYLIGEGGVLFLLKRLEDAKRDGDDIFGIIHSVGGSSEADSKSMIAPTERAVARAIRTAMNQTDIPPEAIGISETHGSANELSDIVEAQALAKELRSDTEAVEPLQITAIKSHVGHLYGGSGAASMFSTIMSLRERIVPGIRLLENVRPQVAELATKVEPRKGTIRMSESTKAGGVNALGLGGANYFAVVSAPSDSEEQKSVHEPARNKSAAPQVRAGDEGVDDVFLCLAEDVGDFLPALERAVSQEPIPRVISEGDEVRTRMAVTFEDEKTLENKLKSAVKMLSGGHGLKPLESQGVFTAQVPEEGEGRKLVFCFPGQGVHYITMGRHLYESDTNFREVVDKVHELAMEEFDFDLLGHIYGDENDEEIKKNLGTLVGAQTALFAVELGMARVYESKGILPEAMVGHSFGEISALAFAGVWDLETAYQVVVERIKAAQLIIASGGPDLGMASVICSDEQRDAILAVGDGKVVLTNINAPGRFVFAGEKDAVKKIVTVAESFGVEARLLPIGAAFHSRYMEPAREPFRAALAKLPCSLPRIPIMSTITGEYIDQENLTSESLAEHLSGQLITPLNLPREIGRLYDDGARDFLEVGPGWAMTKMIGAILEGREFNAVPSLHPKVGDQETFRRARAFLMAVGRVGSAADRQNVPGMFSPDFLHYMEIEEPAILALMEEVHDRYMSHVRVKGGVIPAPAVSKPETAKKVETQKSQAAAAAPKKVAARKSGGDPKVWVERLTEKLVSTTGYPAEMLEVDLDLEADLGVDSVQRAEIWVSLCTEHGLDAETRPSGARTIAQLAEILAQMEGGTPSDETADPEPTAAAEEAPDAADAPVKTAGGGGGDPKVWVERLTEKLVTTTGYPAEMLEVDLDLEADLGVDSVQRAEIWVSLCTEHGLNAETRPSGARTIAQLAEILAGMEGGEPSHEAGGPEPAPLVKEEPAEPSAPAKTAGGGGGDPKVWVERLTEKLVTTTGYPAEMLEVDLDLEADLGVDSVQRAEIWVSLCTEHGLNAETRPSGARTIAQLAEILAGMEGNGGTSEESEGDAEEESPLVNPSLPPLDDDSACRLFLGGSEVIAKEDLTAFPCKRVVAVVAEGDTSGQKLRRRLAKRDIEFTTVKTSVLASGATAGDVEALLEGCDTLVYLAHHGLLSVEANGESMKDALNKATGEIYSSFRALYPVLEKRPLRLIFPVSMDGAFGATAAGEAVLGAFPSGFVRCVAQELPECKVQLMDCGELDWADTIDSNIEIIGPRMELGMTPRGRIVPKNSKVAPSPRYRLPLAKGDLVLVTGGARGIVFECVAALAERTGCRLLLTGRTELPMGRPEWLGASPEEIDAVIRQMEIGLVKNEGMKLPEAKRVGSTARAQWELSRNLDRLEAAGIEVRYEKCDVSDSASFGALIDATSEGEKIRGVVHGAGVQKSKLLAELSDEAISLTIETKLAPMFTMIDKLDWAEVKLLSAFGSIAGLFGNSGQSDYGLANDTLAWMVSYMGSKHDGLFAQTVDWTAWVGTGMVSKEEGKRFEKAGLTPLDVETGVALYLEAVLGSEHKRLAVFNSTAAFASVRVLDPHPAAARPRVKLVEPASGDKGPTAHFSLTEDVYINQHLVKLEPVVPGTFVTELFAEAIAGEGLTPTEIRFRRPLQLRGDELEVEIIRTDGGMMALPANRPELPEKALANLSYATCKLEKTTVQDDQGLVISKKDLKALQVEGADSGASFYDMLDSKFSGALKTGPVFRGLLATMEKGDMFYSTVAITDDAAALLKVPGEFVFNPVLADMAVQVGAAWAMIRHDVMEIPFEIGALHVGQELKERDAVVICREVEINDTESVIDLAVRRLDGELVLGMEKLVLKTIAPREEE